MFGMTIARGITTVADALRPSREKIAAFEADARIVWNHQASGDLTPDAAKLAIENIENRISEERRKGQEAACRAIADAVPSRQAQRSEAARGFVAAFESMIEQHEALKRVELEWAAESAHPELRGLVYKGGLPAPLHRLLFSEDPATLLRHFRDACAKHGLDLGDGRPQRLAPAPRTAPELPASARR